MPYMLDEIHEQPGIITRLVKEEKDSVAKLAAEIRKRDIQFVVMAARGTSDHAAIYGKYLLEIKNSIPVALADCSIFTHYNASLKLNNALVIGISQSGQAQDVAEYLQQSKKSGALTVAITNEEGSLLTQIADHTIYCHARKECAVAATKTYTSTLAALYMLSAMLEGNESRLDKLAKVSDAMTSAFKTESYIAEHASRYRYMERGVIISRGFNYCTALETALKLAETSHIMTRGYSAADIQHGPIAAIHEGDPCFLIAAPGKTYDALVEMAGKLTQRHAEIMIISSEDSILSNATVPVKLDVDMEEELSPLVYILPGQLFAYYLSTTRGDDPDRPEGLSKVTITR